MVRRMVKNLARRLNRQVMDKKLQRAFKSVIASVADSAKKSARNTPIYRRPERNQRSAIKDAATVLSALWNINRPGCKS